MYRTQDYNLIQSFSQQSSKYERRVAVNLNIVVKQQNIYYQIDNGELVDSLITMEKAQKSPVTKEKFLKKLLKTNDTPYDFKINEFSYNEDLFIPLGKIGELKKLIVDKLDQERIIKRESRNVKLPTLESTKNNEKVKYYVEIRTKEQYDVVKSYENIEVLIGDIKLVDEIMVDKTDRLVLPRINYNDEFNEVDSYVQKYSKLTVSELGSLKRYNQAEKDLMTNFTLNVTNQYTLNKLKTMGINSALMSIELNNEKLRTAADDMAVVNIYGRVPVMIMDYCPINENKQDSCMGCRRCHQGTYLLKDELKREFPLMYEGNARIGMYSKAPISLLDKQSELQEMGINKFHLRFTNESTSDVIKVMDGLVRREQIEQETIRGSYYKETL